MNVVSHLHVGRSCEALSASAASVGECRRMSAAATCGRRKARRASARGRPHAARDAIDRLPDALGPPCTHPALKPDSICG